MAKKIKNVTEKSDVCGNNQITFDKPTIALLENFVTINPSIEFIKGDQIDTISLPGTIYASGRLNCNIPRNFVVADLAKFLNVLSMFDQHRVTLREHQLSVDNLLGTQTFTMNYGKLDLIKTPPRDETIEIPSKDAQFEISKEQLQRVQKACNIIGVTDLMFKCQTDNNVSIIGRNNRDSSSDTFALDVIGQVNKHLECSIKLEDLKIMADNYMIEISDQGMGFFKGSLGQQYFIGVEC